MYYLINKQTKEHIPNPSAKQRADVMHDENWDIVLANGDGWIRNSNIGVRPLPDNHKCITKFIDGPYLTPTRAKMWNFDNTLVAYKPIFEDEQITLQPGDYVSTENMTESEYHAVARAFMMAGADKLEYPAFSLFERLPFFGWSSFQENNTLGLYHGTNSAGKFFTGRLLTVEQVINATNSGTQTSSKNLSKTSGVKTGEMRMVCCGCSTKIDTYWDGEEWPAPIGSKVEANDNYGTWRKGVVGYQVNDPEDGMMVLVDFGDDWIVVRPPEIRAIDTQKEELIKAVKEYFCDRDPEGSKTIESIYDAMVKGVLFLPTRNEEI